MKKTSEKISLDLDWNLKREAKSLNLTFDEFVRYIYEFWKKAHQNGLNNEIKGVKR